MSPRAKRAGTCADCGEGFEAGPKGRIPARCPACREKPKDDEEPAEIAPTEGAPYRRDQLLVIADMAAARGLDPVEVLLLAVAEHAKGGGA